MFAHAYDAPYGLAVFLFSPGGRTSADEDLAAYVDCIRTLKAKIEVWQSGPDRLPAAILVIDPGAPLPNARWRKEIAEVSNDLRPPLLFGIVNDSAIVRGTVTAINWVKPLPFETDVFATFEKATAWIESRRGVKLPLLAALLAEARDTAAKSARGTAIAGQR